MLVVGEVFVPVTLELEHGLSEGVYGGPSGGGPPDGGPFGGGPFGGGPPDADLSGGGPSGPHDGSPGAWRPNLDAVALFWEHCISALIVAVGFGGRPGGVSS